MTDFRDRRDEYSRKELVARLRALAEHHTPHVLAMSGDAPWRMICRQAADELSSETKEIGEALCPWTKDEDGNYHTGCGHLFFFDTGTRAENGAKWCLYCGAHIHEEEA